MYAEPVEWLYDVEVSVASRTQASANAALQTAMRICLMRVTGRVEVAESLAVRIALQDPASYVQQYRFATSVNSVGDDNDVLVAHFDQELIQELTKKAGLPIWPSDRPTILLWMSIRGRVESEMVSANTQVGDIVLQRARDRGIRLILPLMDLSDRQLINTSTVDGQFWLDVEQASKRYATDFVVAGSARENILGGARVHLTVWMEESAISSVMEIDDESNALQRGVDKIANFLASRYALARDLQNVVRIRVDEIRTIAAYAGFLKHISEQEFIDGMDVVSYNNGLLEVEVNTPSSSDRLVELMTPYGKLVPRAPLLEGSSDSGVLDFLWNGEK